MPKALLRIALLFAVVICRPLFANQAPAPFIVSEDVPLLASPGSLNDFAFVSYQFNAYSVGLGDPSGNSDYSANFLANDEENYTYLFSPGCAASGRGGHCTPPPPYMTSGYTYSDTYQNVTTPPTGLDFFYHISGKDAVGQPLQVSVSNPGSYTLTLTDNSTGLQVAISAASIFTLGSGAYTLEYQTGYTAAETQVFFINTVPVPGAFWMMAVGLGCMVTLRWPTKSA